MKVIAVTQARSGSTRLPNKVLLKIKGKTLLQIHIDRIKQSKLINGIIIATTDKTSDKVIVDTAITLGVDYYRGSENDVLDRFYQAVKNTRPDYIVRLTSDCPLIDAKLIDEVVAQAKKEGLDYYANIIEEKYPDGQDIEVFKFSALEKAWQEANLSSDREHVTPYIRNNSSYKGGNMFTSNNHGLKQNYNHVRLTVDEPQDFEVIKILVNELGLNKNWQAYADFYLSTPKIKMLNYKIKRNEGYQKSIDED